MLQRDAEADQFQAHACHFIDDFRHVGEPPATEDVQVAEFSREDAEFVLVFAGENGGEEFVFRILRAKILNRKEMAEADGITIAIYLTITAGARRRPGCIRYTFGFF